VELGIVSGSTVGAGTVCAVSTVPVPVVAQPARDKNSSADMKRSSTKTPEFIV
jgi:hypothetical protein